MFLGYALIGVSTVIRSNTVCSTFEMVIIRPFCTEASGPLLSVGTFPTKHSL